MANVNPQWEQFANWLVTTPDQRKRLGLPLNQVQYANDKEISDRQLRRWKENPVFKALLATKQETENPLPSLTPETPDQQGNEDQPASSEEEYLLIKAKMVQGALTGDPKYLDLYFKAYGKEFIAEEVAAITSDLAGLDMIDLIKESISLLGLDLIIEHLQNLGYTVEEKSDE